MAHVGDYILVVDHVYRVLSVVFGVPTLLDYKTRRRATDQDLLADRLLDDGLELQTYFRRVNDQNAAQN